MKLRLFSLFFFFTFIAAQAQNQPTTDPATNALQEHFNRLKSSSNHYKENNRQYKVIEMTRLNAFWESVLQTVKTQEENILKASKSSVVDLEKANANIAAQANQIAALKQENAKQAQAVEQNSYEVNNISVLGLGVNKQLFVILTFVCIIGLLILAGIMASLYKKSKMVADEKIKAFQAVELELNETKKTARERELKVKRELQTELNSKEELRQQLAAFQKQG